MLADALTKHANEATAHSLSRLSGDRPRYVKLFWTVAFLTFLGLCVMRIREAFLNYSSGNLKTTIRANELNFEFPDVYICNESPISGSYSVTLSAEDSAVLRHYRQLVNNSLAGIYPKILVENYAIRLVNTLPYQFLADKMARRANQLVVQYYFNGNLQASLKILRHPQYLNCFMLNFTDSERHALQSPKSYLQIGLFLDPLLPAPFDNSTDQDILPLLGSFVDVKPTDWDKDYGTDSSVPTGFQIYFVPKGQYPSNSGVTLSVGPGQSHRLSIKMLDTVYHEEVSGRCVGNNQGEALVDFFDPYTEAKETFNDSQTVCWHREVALLSMERFKCIFLAIPLLWEFRNAPHCFNLTQFPKGLVFSDEFMLEREQMLFNATLRCAAKVPCRQRTYSFDYSSGSWPSERDWNSNLRLHAAGLVNLGGPTPGLSYLVNNATFQQVRESLMLLEMSAAEFRSQEVVLSLAYNFSSLIADIGGLLGLFLGMSLLSVLELLELLHDCCLIGWRQLRASMKRKSKTDPR